MDRIGAVPPLDRRRSGAVGAAVAVLPPRAVRGFDVDAFSQLPVLEGGRVKPIDSVARNSLLVIRGQQSFRFEDRTVGPEEWLLDVLFRPELADRQPIFVINDPEVLGLMGLQQSSNRYFSFAAIAPHIQEIERQAQAAQRSRRRSAPASRAPSRTCSSALYLYFRLKNTLQISGSAGLAPGGRHGGRAGRAPSATGSLEQLAHFRPIPPAPGSTGDAWLNVGAGALPARRPASRSRRSARGRASRSPTWRRTRAASPARWPTSGRWTRRPGPRRSRRPATRWSSTGRSPSTAAWWSTCSRSCCSSPPGRGSRGCSSRRRTACWWRAPSSTPPGWSPA